MTITEPLHELIDRDFTLNDEVKKLLKIQLDVIEQDKTLSRAEYYNILTLLIRAFRIYNGFDKL